MKCSTASGPMVETHRDFWLGATGPRLLAPPGPFKALARTSPTVEKWLLILMGSVVLVVFNGFCCRTHLST